MVENSENRPEDKEAGQESGSSEDVIELSDIAIGTTQEDEEIIELTEELLDEAMGAVSSATGDSEEGETLDLSEAEKFGAGETFEDSALSKGEAAVTPQEPLSLDEEESEEVEEHISQELDNFSGEGEPGQFTPSAPETDQPPEEGAESARPSGPGAESEQPSEPDTPQTELEATIERVIEEKLADRFEKMFADIIDARLKESMEQLKQELLEAGQK